MNAKIDAARVQRVAQAYHDAVAHSSPRGHLAVERLFELMGECLIESAPDGLGGQLRRAINAEIDTITIARMDGVKSRGTLIPWAVVLGGVALVLILVFR